MSNPLYHIFKKELTDTLRDRRTLMAMIVIPVLIFPLFFPLITGITKSFNQEALDKEMKIGILDGENSNPLVEFIENAPLGKISFISFEDTTEFSELIRKDSLQIALLFEDNFIHKFNGEQTAQLNVMVNSTDIFMRQRVDAIFNQYAEIWRNERLNRLSINPEKIEPLNIVYNDIASDKEKLGKIAGGFLPYLFIIFCFIGCMYPAIDLFTGEKERGTIETILSTPVKRWQLLFGKMAVVVLSGLMAATLALVGLFFAFEFMNIVEDESIKEVVRSILSFKFIILMYSLLIPLSIFFAGLMIPITVYAKTFKEAQSIITPLNIIVILPAVVGFLPGVELNVTTALIPIINIVLAIKEIIAGTIDPLLLFMCFSSLVVLAMLAVVISHKQYGKESNILI